MARLKRKRYIINKRLQVGIFLKWTILPIILFFATLYYFKSSSFVLVFGVIVIALVSWRVMVLSHRLAGPIYRLEKDLQDIAKGNFSMRINFRKKDELKSIAEGINKILDEMEKRLEKK
ncbi:MAG: methyl-accepting chemotaxis protein [Candidatus Omnitrophica bacterium]|nr:methyl-accepting chemotaxis protein [Candidatus Omnitrophota bacterium]